MHLIKILSLPSLSLAIEQFNHQDFYACHDTLEALWLEAEPTDRNFYQGILQLAVGCYHWQNLNQRGALILWGEGIRRLCVYQPHHQGVVISPLVAEFHHWLQFLQGLATAELPFGQEELLRQGPLPTIQLLQLEGN